MNSTENKFKIIHNPENCPVRTILDKLGDKWSMLVIMTLSDNGVMRFNEMHKAIGISQKMLTVTLRSLESDGLVSRKIYPQIPPKVEYKLTEMGDSLVPHISGLSQWAVEHQDMILKARVEYKNR